MVLNNKPGNSIDTSTITVDVSGQTELERKLGLTPPLLTDKDWEVIDFYGKEHSSVSSEKDGVSFKMKTADDYAKRSVKPDEFGNYFIQVTKGGFNPIVHGVPKNMTKRVAEFTYNNVQEKYSGREHFHYQEFTPEFAKEDDPKGSEGVKKGTQKNLGNHERSPKRAPMVAKDVLHNQKALNLLKSKGVIIEGGRIKNPELLKQYQPYVDILVFLEKNSSRDEAQKISDKKGAAEKFLWLTAESSNTIWDKKYIALKYANAIYNDIIREGAFLHKHPTTGLYSIQEPNAEIKGDTVTINDINNKQLTPKDPSLSPYEAILNGANINDEYWNVAVLTSIMGKTITNPEGVVGQKQFLSTIFNRHGIVPYKGAEHIAEPNYSLMDKGSILDQIKTIKEGLFTGRNKVGDKNTPDSMQRYQELIFLENYLGGEGQAGDYIKESYNKELFTLSNQYRQQYIREEVIMDALQGNGKGKGPETIGDMIKNNAGSFGILGVVMLAFKDFRKYGLGILGAAILSDPIASMVDGGINKGKAALGMTGIKISDTELDLIKPRELTKPLSLNDYQEKYKILHAQNITNQTSKRVVDNMETPSLHGDRLYEIMQDVTINEIDVSMNSSNIAGDIISQLALAGISPKAEQQEDGKETSSDLEARNYTIDDLVAFVTLLQSSNLAESGDKTTLDYLSDGVDISRYIFNENIIGNSGFDLQINAELNKGFSELDRKSQKDRVQLAERMKKEFSGVSEFFNAISHGEVPSFDEINQDVANIKEELVRNGIEMPELEKILDNIAVYMKAEKGLDKFDGIFDQNKDSILEWVYTKMLGFESLESEGEIDLHSLAIDLEKEINILVGLKITGDLAKVDPFSELNNRIDKHVSRLKSVLDSVNATLNNSAGPVDTPNEEIHRLYLSHGEEDVKELLNKTTLAKNALKHVNVSGIDLDDLGFELSKIYSSSHLLSTLTEYSETPEVGVKTRSTELKEANALRSELAVLLETQETETDTVKKATLQTQIDEVTAKVKIAQSEYDNFQDTPELQTIANARATAIENAKTGMETLIKIKEQAEKRFEVYYTKLDKQTSEVQSLDVSDSTKLLANLEKIQEAKSYLDVTLEGSLLGLGLKASASHSKNPLGSFEIGSIDISATFTFPGDRKHEEVQSSYDTMKQVFPDMEVAKYSENPSKKLVEVYTEKQAEILKVATGYVVSMDVNATELDIKKDGGDAVVKAITELVIVKDAFKSESALVKAVDAKIELINKVYLKIESNKDKELLEACQKDISFLRKQIADNDDEISNGASNASELRRMNDKLSTGIKQLENMAHGRGTIGDKIESVYKETNPYTLRYLKMLGITKKDIPQVKNVNKQGNADQPGVGKSVNIETEAIHTKEDEMFDFDSAQKKNNTNKEGKKEEEKSWIEKTWDNFLK